MDPESCSFFLAVSENTKESVLRVVIAGIHKRLKGQTQSGTMLNYLHNKIFTDNTKKIESKAVMSLFY